MQTEHQNVEYDLETGLPIKNEERPYVQPVITGEEIVGGAKTDDFPDCCAVGDEKGYYCSGTLIASNVVVTAAHCCDAKRVYLKGGDVDKPEEGETIPVAKQIFHQDLDLSVLILDQHSTVEPRHVAQGAEVTDVKTAMVAGFGAIDLHGSIGYGIKRCVTVPVMSLDGSNPGDPERYACRPGHEIVAGHRGLKRDTCRGDSGISAQIRILTFCGL